ncbi:MAG: hypothetical protein TECD_00772 [Hyphomicrobiaceae bacterium hypho_1]
MKLNTAILSFIVLLNISTVSAVANQWHIFEIINEHDHSVELFVITLAGLAFVCLSVTVYMFRVRQIS